MSGERTVKAVLKADCSQFVASMRSAQKATKDFAADAKSSAGKSGAAWTSTGTGMMATGAVIGAGLGLAVKSFMDFDAAMSQAQAGTMATGASLGALRAAAIDAGAKTQFSATEAAQAITAMGKAGVSTKDILGGGLTGALDLAAAGQLDVAAAAEIAATAMTQFGLSGKDLPHVADLLAAGAGKAQGSVQDLAGALKYVGPVAKGLGVSIEETTGVLAEFASQGIIGEQAGTSLRGVMLSLTSPSQVAAKAMENLGINMYDANGEFIGMKGAAGELQAKLGPLDNATRNAALGQIFGNEQITAARILYEGGAPAVDKWTKSVNDTGFAAKQAAMLSNNLKGDVERLGGSISSVLIQSGSAANGMLRTMTQELQSGVDLYGSLPVPVQQGATALGAVAAAAFLAGGGLLVLAPRIVATKVALEGMGRTGALMSRGLSGMGSMLMGPVGVGLAAGTLALGYYAKQAQESSARVDELTATLDSQTGAVTDNTRAWATKRLSDDGTLALAKSMGISLKDVTDAALGNADATARVSSALDAYGVAAQKASGVAELNATENGAAAANMVELGGAVRATAGETDQAATKAKLLMEANAAGGEAAAAAAVPSTVLADAEKDLAAAAEATKKAHDDLTAAIAGFGSAMMTARGDARSYEAAIDAAQASVKANGRTLDITTEKGRNNASALDGIATAALKAAESNLGLAEQNGKLGAATKNVTGDIDKARAAFITQATAMGMPKRAAEELATKAGLSRDRVQEITTKLINLGKQAPKPTITVLGVTEGMNAVDNLAARLKSLKDRHITVTTSTKGGVDPGYASGGYVRGPGSTTSDSIRAPWLSDKEYVVNAAATAKYGVANLDAINSMRFAAGGYVGPAPATSPAPIMDISALTAGQAATTTEVRKLGDRFGDELQKQARTIETMRRQMAGAR